MGMIKIIAQRRQPTHRLVAAAFFGKAESFVPIAHTVGQIKALNRASLGRVPPQRVQYLRQLSFAGNGSALDGFDATALSVFDHLGIEQRLRDAQHGLGGPTPLARARHAIAPAKDLADRRFIARFPIGKQRRQGRFWGHQFTLRIQADRVPLIAHSTRCVHFPDLPFFFRHKTPFFVKLKRFGAQAAHHAVMHLATGAPTHKDQTANRILAAPHQLRRRHHPTTSIQMVDHRHRLCFTDLAVEQVRPFALAKLYATCATAQISNPIGAIDLAQPKVEPAGLTVELAFAAQTTQFLYSWFYIHDFPSVRRGLERKEEHKTRFISIHPGIISGYYPKN